MFSAAVLHISECISDFIRFSVCLKKQRTHFQQVTYMHILTLDGR